MIDRCSDLFGKIGLKINKEKCQSTVNGNIEFMGIEFGLNTRNLPIADNLIKIC